MSDDIFDWMAAANRKAKGKRPEYFDDPKNEQLLSILMAVVGEVSVMRERFDTVERLLEDKGTLTRTDIENFTPDKQAAQERGEMIREYIYRVMRGPHQMVQELQQEEPPVEQVSRDLKEI